MSNELSDTYGKPCQVHLQLEDREYLNPSVWRLGRGARIRGPGPGDSEEAPSTWPGPMCAAGRLDWTQGSVAPEG